MSPLLPLVGMALAGPPDRAEIDATLDALHRAAAEADADTYFGLFTDDAVFVGTDASEVWDLPGFRAFAADAFSEAPAWDYTPTERRVRFDDKGRTAWFFEALTHARYGAVRGSGVVVRRGKTWRVAQYVLSFPIPNDVAPDVLALVQGDGSEAGGDVSDALPTPFTAAQIRASCVPGTTIVTRETRPNEPSTVARTTFVAGDETTATFRFEALDGARGEPVGQAHEGTATWEELRDHAAFPAGSTTWAEETLDLPLGAVPTRRYRVVDGDTVRTFWFSPAHPGPPLRMRVEQGGTIVSESTALAWERGTGG